MIRKSTHPADPSSSTVQARFVPVPGDICDPDLNRLRGMTVLITGAGGMLGRAFVEGLRPLDGDVRVLALTHEQLDVTNGDAVLARAPDRPDVILHCAGLALADACEREPERARKVHVSGTRNVGRLALVTGARVVYPQSVFIFDGRELPVTERTRPSPGFVYSKVKLAAEQYLLAEVPGTLTIRMAGFFGGDEKDKNFVGKFVQELADLLDGGETVVEVGDRVWQPTYTLDLARNSLLLAAMRCHGVYHMGAIGEARFYDVARVCVDALGLGSRMTVVPCASVAFEEMEAARRPAQMVTANERLVAEGLCRQRPWEDALREYLQRPYFDKIRRAARR